jgi:hypothetical protein
LYQAASAAFPAAADVEVVADEMEKRLVANEIAGAVDGVTVTERLGLVYEVQPPGMIADFLGIPKCSRPA